MQLLIILALILYGGNKRILDEVKPVLENFGGEEMKNALREAEQISRLVNAVGAFAPDAAKVFDADEAEKAAKTAESGGSDENGERAEISFPLAPVSGIADRDIAYSLSQYLSA